MKDGLDYNLDGKEVKAVTFNSEQGTLIFVPRYDKGPFSADQAGKEAAKALLKQVIVRLGTDWDKV